MDQATQKKYNYWQWRTLILLMIGYMLFYFVRKNFSITMPALESELGISKTKLGLFLTLNGIIYGVSRFINGFLADRVSRKKMMALGLLLSAVVNILIGLSPEMNGLFHFLDGSGKATAGMIIFIGSLWMINGYTQGMGYPPCGSLMAHWIKPSELAFKQSIWNSSHSIGAGLVAIICGSLILKPFGYEAWQWCFFIPAILSIAGAAMLFFGLKDTPASVGLPDPETIDEKFEKIMDKVYGVKDRIDEGIAFLNEESTRRLILLLKKKLFRLLKEICPRDYGGEVRFGFSDPFTTGQAASAAAVLYPVYQDRIHVEPRFDREEIFADLSLRGRIRLFPLAAAAVQIWFSRDFQKVFKRLKNRKKDDGGKHG